MEIQVQKEYHHRIKGIDKVLTGTIEIPCGSYAEGASKVSAMMDDVDTPLQTIDPRIEWDEDFSEGDGWDYVDFSFTVVE